ncbi:MAG: hypothetical protein WD766_04935 [Gemmatimonadota bacterium]
MRPSGHTADAMSVLGGGVDSSGALTRVSRAAPGVRAAFAPSRATIT